MRNGFRILTALACMASLARMNFAQAVPEAIRIVVVEGEGAMNNTGLRGAQDAVVRIEDTGQRPVVGAAVVFTLPTGGPSGEYPGGEKTLIVTTNERGEAAARGFRANRLAGRLQIHVNASYRGLTARTNITQFNSEVPGQRAGRSTKAILLLLAAGAAAAGGVVATQNKSGAARPGPGAPVPPAIGITPGVGTISGPR